MTSRVVTVPVNRAKVIKKKISKSPLKKIKIKKVYKKVQCAFIKKNGERCKRFAYGKSQFCNLHQKDMAHIDKTNLLTMDESILDVSMKNNLGGLMFDPIKHPMEVIMLAKEGLSPVEIAAELGISEYTLSAWTEKYEPFYDAMEIAKTLHEAWWITQGKGALNDRYYNNGMFKFLTANKLGYAEKLQTQNTHNVNAGVLVVPGTSVSEDEWEAQGESA